MITCRGGGGGGNVVGSPVGGGGCHVITCWGWGTSCDHLLGVGGVM